MMSYSCGRAFHSAARSGSPSANASQAYPARHKVTNVVLLRAAGSANPGQQVPHEYPNPR